MVFCCNLLKDFPVPNFMLNGVAIDNALVRKFYMCTEIVRISLFKSFAPPCRQVRYGAMTVLNRCENDVLHTTMFLEKLSFCLPRDCRLSCLPRVICQHVRF